RNPAASWTGSVFLVAWADSRAETDVLAQFRGDLFAARVTSDGTVLDPNGFAYANETRPEMQPFAGGRDGRGFVGGSVFLADAPFAALRIGYRILNEQSMAAVPRPPLAAARLHGARPNPFNPRTTVVFELARGADVSLRIFDLRGRLVRRLHQGPLAAGRHELLWNGRDDAGRELGSGVYLFRLEGAGEPATGRCALVR
ncbi:MAG: FlgD immunoglobulin-like domain containing protein, partial [Candidatus Krumholzibacteriia bacterium]